MATTMNSPFKADINRRTLLSGVAIFTATSALGAATPAFAGLTPSDDTWNEIKSGLFDDLNFVDGTDVITLVAPKRAHDASIVPLDISISDKHNIERLTIVIDENPVPLAAQISYGPASAEASIKTRVRVNAYSYVRVIAHTRDGTQFMVKRFVKASGGCAAPSGKDPAAAKANMGKMKLRRFVKNTPREAQVMVRHPNHSGFQMNQITLLFVPADFVETIDIKQGDDMILKVESGISLSEDPNLRFFYKEDPALPIQVTAVDTEGRTFSHSWTSADA